MTCKISYATVKRSSLDFLTGRWLATYSCWLFLAKVCEWVHTYLHFSGSSFFFSPKSTYPCRHTASPAATLSTAVTCHFQNRQLTGQPDESALETIFRVPPPFRFTRTSKHNSLLHMLICQPQALHATSSLAVIFTNTTSHRDFFRQF